MSKTKTKQTFAQIGVSHKKHHKRAENDFYSTDPIAIEHLLKYEKFNKNIWEPACGNGNLVKKLKTYGYHVKATDIINRGCPESTTQDFLKTKEKYKGDIITNPPYTYATEFIEQAYKLTEQKVAMFLKIQFLETIKRYERIFKKFPPKTIYVFVKRVKCYKNNNKNTNSSAICYGWFIWDKKYKGETIIKWIPNHK